MPVANINIGNNLTQYNGENLTNTTASASNANNTLNSKDSFSKLSVQDITYSTLKNYNSLSLSKSDVAPSQKDIEKSGTLGSKIAEDITKQIEKNIEKLNKYNLSKGNRLLKKIEFQA